MTVEIPASLKVIRIPGLYRFGGLYVLVLLLVVFSLLLPETFPTVLNFRTMLVSQSFLAIAALGLLCAAINGEFDLSIGFLSGFVGALVAWLSIEHGWPAIAAAMAGMVTAAIVGVVNGFLVVKVGIMSFIATLGTGTVLSGLTLWVTGGKVLFGMPRDLIAIGHLLLSQCPRRHPRRRLVLRTERSPGAVDPPQVRDPPPGQVQAARRGVPGRPTPRRQRDHGAVPGRGGVT